MGLAFLEAVGHTGLEPQTSRAQAARVLLLTPSSLALHTLEPRLAPRLAQAANPWVVTLGERRRAGSGTLALTVAQALGPRE